MTGTHSPTAVSPKREMNLRKISKPLIEKKRRARINGCLSQLKEILLNSVAQSATQISKLEKADILEMTVQYLQSIQLNKVTSQNATDVNRKYASGFRECATEVVRYLKNSSHVDTNLKNRIENHLGNCMNNLEYSSGSPGVSGLQLVQDNSRLSPLKIEIPSTNGVKYEKACTNGHQQLLIPVNVNSNNFVNMYNFFHIASAFPRNQQLLQSDRNKNGPSHTPGHLSGVQASADVWRPW